MRNFALETFFSKWEFAARYHMTASDTESMTLSELLAMASPIDREKFEELHLGYTETYGLPELREEIAKTYDTAAPEYITPNSCPPQRTGFESASAERGLTRGWRRSEIISNPMSHEERGIVLKTV